MQKPSTNRNPGRRIARRFKMNVVCPAANFRVCRLFRRPGLRASAVLGILCRCRNHAALAANEAEGGCPMKECQRQRAHFLSVLMSLVHLALLSGTESMAGTYPATFP